MQVSGPVIEGKRLSVPGYGGLFAGLDQYLQLMHKCWSQDPHERPSFSEIVDKLE
jgi:hypothetical protein